MTNAIGDRFQAKPDPAKPLAKVPAFLLATAFLMAAAGIVRPSPAFAEYIQLDVVANVKTQFSDGCSTATELGNIAQHRGVDVVIFSDHDRRSLEYGVWPLRKILRKKAEHPSILSQGAANYLAEIRKAGEKFKDLLLIPAVESAPFYYWTGSVFDKNLVANDWDKRLLLVGLPTAEDYERLPLLDNAFSTRYARQFFNEFLFYCVLFLVLAGLAFKRVARKATVPLAVLALLLALDHHPFPSSPFDQYHGDRGVKPYQELIDYAVSKGALAFWSHVEPRPGAGVSGSVGISTQPHPQDLALSENYTGFQAVSDEPVHAAEPGNEWDHLLTQYIQGKKTNPVWGYGGNDFHCEGQENHKFGGARTVVLVAEKTPATVFDALLHGRMYAVRQPSEDNRLSLDQFVVADKAVAAIAGEEIATLDAPEVKVKIGSSKGSKKQVKVSVIRNGAPVKEETGDLPYEFSWRDTDVVRKGRAYYRLKAETESGDYLLSNPVFVRFSETPPQVASIPPQGAPPPVAEKLPEPQAPKPAEPQPPATLPSQEPKALETRAPAAPEPKIPAAPEPAEKKVSPPQPQPPALKEPVKLETPVKKPEPPPKPAEAPKAPKPEPKSEPEAKQEPKQRYVVPRIDGVVLKKTPDAAAPQIATADKGERLLLVERTGVLYNDKPWLLVQKGKLSAYVWEPLVKPE